jgi:ferredoxin
MARIDALILCDCGASMEVDAASAGRAVGARRVKTCSHLCTSDIDIAAKVMGQPGNVIIACEQEAGRFAELAAETGAYAPITADIRDRAGWGATPAFAKQAALLAEAALDRPATPLIDISSPGTLLILGNGEADAALHAAARLCGQLAVTCVLEAEPEMAAPAPDFDLALGRVVQAGGALGRFDVSFEAFSPALPGGRGPVSFLPPSARARSACDIILDLRKGTTPLFPSPHKRDGYLRADPGDRAAVEAAIFDAAGLQGVFEKPLYVHLDAPLCAHSRAGQVGCRRCLDICPTGAITPSGDHVSVDPRVCAGCGGCAAVCPSGAVTYDDPQAEFLFLRLSTLADAYRAAGGSAPRLLIHDQTFGAEMIALSARYGQGLPANVIPLAVNNAEGVGHAELLAACAVGFAEVSVLMTPRTDPAVPEAQLAIARAVLEGAGHDPARLRLIAPADPGAMETALGADAPAALVSGPILPLGGRREVTRLAATALARGAPGPLPLPEGAPYGAVLVDAQACTLCLACVSLCPSGALGDHPDKPLVSFRETACLQCGLCVSACPENAVTMRPQLDTGPTALAARILHEEEPFACISCGKPFGVRSTIERIAAKLEGSHPMFTGSNNGDLIRMCDDCRVKAQYHSDASPMAGGERRPVRRTEDYLKKPH